MNSENDENVDWKKESEFWRRSFFELSKSTKVPEMEFKIPQKVPEKVDTKLNEPTQNSAVQVAHNDNKRKPLHKKKVKRLLVKVSDSGKTSETASESSQGSSKDTTPNKKPMLSEPISLKSKLPNRNTFNAGNGPFKKTNKNSRFLKNQEKSKKAGRKQNKANKLAAYLKVAISNDVDRKNAERIKKSEESVQNNSNKRKTDITTASLVEIDNCSLKKLRAQLTKRRNELLNHPKLTLNATGLNASLCLNQSTNNSNALFVVDLQSLLVRAIGGDAVVENPKWCHLTHVTKIHNITVLIVNGLSSKDYKRNFGSMPNMNSIFNLIVEIIPPMRYGSSIEQDLVWVGLSTRFRKSFCKDQALVEAGVEKGLLLPLVNCREVFNIIKTEQGEDKKKVVYVFPDGQCTKLSLLLNLQQMYKERFPFPGRKSKLGRLFVATKDVYDRVSEDSPMFGLDCEMCRTKNQLNELTRISVVDENLKLIYDKLVKPKSPIIDYLTQFSGITPAMMRDVTYTIADVQRDLINLFPGDAILVGQSLTSDMNALEMSHPYIIDTSIIYNLTGKWGGKTGLKKLSEIFLGEKIQCAGAAGHDSFEDSAAALKLVLLKLGKGLKFGDVRWNKADEEKIRRLEIVDDDRKPIEKLENVEPLTTDLSINLLKYIEMGKKKAAVVHHSDSKFYEKAFRAFSESVLCKVELDSNLGICSRLEEVSNKYDLNIGHFSLKQTEETDPIKEFDAIVKRIDNGLPKNALLMVIASQSEGPSPDSNGLCFVKVKNLENSKVKFD